MRGYISYQRGQTQTPMSTEYRDSFLPPKCYMTVVSSTTQKNPYHSLKGTTGDITTFRSFYVKKKWIKKPVKAAEPSVSPRQLVSRVNDYTSVYKQDFRAWKGIKQQSQRNSKSPKVNHRLAVKERLSKDARPLKDSARVETNRKPQTSSPPAAGYNRFLSTTHADYRPHKCQITKPILPEMQIATSKEPFHTMTTMRADYRAWNTQQCFPVSKVETVCKKRPISPAQACTANYRLTEIISVSRVLTLL